MIWEYVSAHRRSGGIFLLPEKCQQKIWKERGKNCICCAYKAEIIHSQAGSSCASRGIVYNIVNAIQNNAMTFYTNTVTVLSTLVSAIGAGLGVWGVINLLEGYGNDNRATRL